MKRKNNKEKKTKGKKSDVNLLKCTSHRIHCNKEFAFKLNRLSHIFDQQKWMNFRTTNPKEVLVHNTLALAFADTSYTHVDRHTAQQWWPRPMCRCFSFSPFSFYLWGFSNRLDFLIKTDAMMTQCEVQEFQCDIMEVLESKRQTDRESVRARPYRSSFASNSIFIFERVVAGYKTNQLYWWP